MGRPPPSTSTPQHPRHQPLLGAHPYSEGTRFSLQAPVEALTLLLFEHGLDAPSREICFDPKTDRRGTLWSRFVPDIRTGTGYAYRVPNLPNQQPWIVDPWARRIGSNRAWGEPGRRDGLEVGIIVDDAYDWGDDTRPAIPIDEAVVYEVHLRGATARAADGGTYRAFIDRIPHLRDLGINVVEFLPLVHFDECEYNRPPRDPRRDLRNFWGYSSLAFFAPMSRYGSNDDLRELVHALHAAGIEVWIDMVYNHTGESAHRTWAFQALDPSTWYLPEDYSGCGNTVNCNHPQVRQFILESLRHWAVNYRIDGFRFDLASILCRGEWGEVLPSPPLIELIEADPLLQGVKLVAEAWDAGGAYLVGSFPGPGWTEWNGKFRDDVRRFWAGESNRLSALATRLTGSDDLYGQHRPQRSINFVTCHDGFTLRDLVSYEHKHNAANQENNRDGESHNHSVNFGVEGPTDNPAIRAVRRQRQKNLLATLLLAHGVPMLTAGDEIGRSQGGNNNAYCQDNPTSWIDWDQADPDLLAFTRHLIALRRDYPVLRPTEFVGAAGRGQDQDRIVWFGPEGRDVDWSDRVVGYRLCDADSPERDVVVLINGSDKPARFALGANWRLALSTATPDPAGTGSFVLPPDSVQVALRQLGGTISEE